MSISGMRIDVHYIYNDRYIDDDKWYFDVIYA